MKRYYAVVVSSIIVLYCACTTEGSIKTGGGMAAPSQPQDLSSAQVIGVMPFVNQTRNKNIEWLGVGVADSISAKLAAVKSLVVVERAQISNVVSEMEMGMTGLIDENQAPKVGKMLGAKTLVMGSFAGVKASGKLIIRFNCKIVNTETGRLLGGGGIRANGKLENIFNMEEKIAELITKRVGIALTGAERRYLARATSKSITSYELYSQALTEPDPARKKRMLERALDYDRNFARAHLALGYIIYELGVMKGKSPKLVKHLKRALKIDPKLINAHYILASYYDRLSRVASNEDQIVANEKKAAEHYRIYIQQAGSSPLPNVQRRIKRSQRRINKLSS